MAMNHLNTRVKTSPNAAILGTSASLHLAFIILFDKVTAFAPDENNYIGVFQNLYKRDFTLEGYLGWNEGSVNVLRFMYLPAKAMQLVGFSDFYSIRLLAVIYSLLSLYLLLKACPNHKILGAPVKFWISFAYFIPSIFVWTSLGLRESFIFLALTGVFYAINTSLHLEARFRFAILFLSALLLLVSKIYLYGLLLIAMLFSFVLISIIKKRLQIIAFKIIAVALLPLLFFPSKAINLVTSAQSTIGSKMISPAAPNTRPSDEKSNSQGNGGSESGDANMDRQQIATRGQTLHDLSEQLDRNPLLAWLSELSGFNEVLEKKSSTAYLPSGSKELKENFTQLQTTPASLRDPLSVIMGGFNFLFIPLPFVDNGSFFLNAQSYESFIWYLYYAVFLVLIFGLVRKFDFDFSSVTVALFPIGFILLSALVEINDGTSVRHRAVLLIAILSMLTIFRKRPAPKV